VLEELEQAGLVVRLELGGGLSRFEPARIDDHHHHLVCDDCGDIVPFEDQGLERVIKRISRDVSFEVTAHDVVLHGTCGECTTSAG
jgi:Fur family ferric uptake transcriptional regulator